MRKSFKSGNTGDNNGGGGDDGEPNENCKFGPTFGWTQIFFFVFSLWFARLFVPLRSILENV